MGSMVLSVNRNDDVLGSRAAFLDDEMRVGEVNQLLGDSQTTYYRVDAGGVRAPLEPEYYNRVLDMWQAMDDAGLAYLHIDRSGVVTIGLASHSQFQFRLRASLEKREERYSIGFEATNLVYGSDGLDAAALIIGTIDPAQVVADAVDAATSIMEEMDWIYGDTLGAGALVKAAAVAAARYESFLNSVDGGVTA